MFEHKGNLELWLDTSISCNPSAREHYSCFRTTLDNPSPVLSRFDTSRWKTQKMLMLQTTKQTTKNDIDRPSFYFCLISRPCSSQLAPRMIVPLTARNGIGRWHPLIQIRLFSRQSHSSSTNTLSFKTPAGTPYLPVLVIPIFHLRSSQNMNKWQRYGDMLTVAVMLCSLNLPITLVLGIQRSGVSE